MSKFKQDLLSESFVSENLKEPISDYVGEEVKYEI